MQLSDDARIGTVLAGYRIGSLLGVGGMSVVYLAEDLRLKRRVALKLLAASLAEDASFRDRFLRESELAASIDHPNIVPIYGAGETGGRLYIAMRYVAGLDLKDRLRSGRLDPAAATGIVAQLASALDAAHARGLAHRDVKPSNVLLDRAARPDASDHVYLADFGLTQQLSDLSGPGDDGQLTGTIDYVAPEQIAGDEVDGRADVYSLGCVLYECLVGRPPFRRGSDLAVVFAHLEADPPLPSAERPELPAALDRVIATALAKRPEERYASCGALARDALGVAVDEAGRRLVDAASRAAAGRARLGEVEAELAGKVIDLRAAREHARALAEPVAGAAGVEICPFKGLATFEQADADLFFGRERLVAELVARLAGAGFLAVVGPSGSGKSSVLRAGLLPALAEGGLPASESWRRVLLRPGERPMGELRRALGSDAEDPLAEALGTLARGRRLLVAVDQLEELHTACRSEGERAAFADALARAAQDPAGRAVVVVALRADYYGHFAARPGLAGLLGGNQVLVGPMHASELRRAVELPAGRVGLGVEPELADALVDDVEGEPGALPLLSTALLELWLKREDHVLTLAAYRASGGIHGAVARLAEETYVRIPDGRRQLVRAMLLRLVGEDAAETPVRRRAPLSELDADRDAGVAAVLAELAGSRLVTVGEDTVEVAHEALLREWPRLREWIDEDAEGRRLHRHVTQAAAGWEAAGRDSAELYRGARLAAALEWSADHGSELNELERDFLARSREASEREVRRARRANRRLRGLLAGVAVLLAASLAGGVLALVQRGDARAAATAQLAQRLGAQALVEEDLARSLLLARQAVEIDDSPQTRSYLLAALLRSPRAVGVMHGAEGADFGGIALSPDGGTLAVGDFFNDLYFFDARTYEQRRAPLHFEDWVESVAYSPDGDTLAYGRGHSVRLLDARTREEIADAFVNGLAGDVAFTRDGSRLVVLATLDGGGPQIGVLDARTLEPIGPTIQPDGFWPRFIWSYARPPHFALAPDGAAVVTASEEGELAWWDLRSGRRTRSLEIETGFHAVALAPDGRTAAVGSDGGIQLVDARTGAIRTASAGLVGSPSWVLFSPDGRIVVSANEDGTVTVWDAATAKPVETLRGHAASQPVFGSDGTTLYTAGDGTVIAWDLTRARGIGRSFRFTHDRAFDPDQDRHPGRFSPDGRLIAVGLKQRGVQLLRTSDLRRAGRPLLETDGEVKALGFSPDGKTLAALTGMGALTLWDVASRSPRHGVLYTPPGHHVGIDFSPDGKTLATSGDGGVELWDAAGGRPVGSIPATAADVDFSGDGQVLALAEACCGGVKRAQVWDVATRSLIARFEGGAEGDALSVALSDDGRLLAVGGFGRVVRVWDVRTRRLLHALEVSNGEALEFSRDGRLLVVGGSLWDVATGTQIGPTLTAGRRTTTVDLSSDGRRLLMTSADGRGAVWDVDPASWARRACALANRTLTREEWGQFLPGRPYEPACA